MEKNGFSDTYTNVNGEEDGGSVVTLSGVVFPEMFFSAFVEKAKVGMFLTQDNLLQYVNPTLAAFTGDKPVDIIGRRADEMLLVDNLDDLSQRISITETGKVKSLCFPGQVRHRDGHVVDVELHGTRVEYRGRDAVFGVVVDVSERLRKEREIRESRELLRKLTAHINSVREEQRARIAREIHDVLGGILTSVKMDANRILRRADSPELIEIAEDMIGLVQESINTVREMSEQLHPGLLEHLGLLAAMKRQLEQYSKRHGIVCTLSSSQDEITLGQEQAIAVYRIFQEALTNVSRHAGASQIEVHLAMVDNLFRMDIADNGRGIDPVFVRDNAMGIIGMKERAREAGGQVVMEQPAEGGTRLCLTLKPVP